MPLPPDTTTETHTAAELEQQTAAAAAAAAVERPAPDAMRRVYRELSDGEQKLLQLFKDHGAAFLDLCNQLAPSRELSIARTKMEEAVMWAVKHVTR